MNLVNWILATMSLTATTDQFLASNVVVELQYPYGTVVAITRTADRNVVYTFPDQPDYYVLVKKKNPPPGYPNDDVSVQHHSRW